MTQAVLAALGPVVWRALLGQADPAATDLIRSGYAQLGFLGLLLAGGWWAIRTEQKRAREAEAMWKERLASAEAMWKERQASADARTAAERVRAEEREADSRAVRDVFIKDVVPTMTLQTARFEQLLEGMERVVGVVERVMNSALERPK